MRTFSRKYAHVMTMKKFASEYTHVDGSCWAGPTFYADTWAEAEAAAMEYPIQPMRIIGQLLDEIPAGADVGLIVDRHKPQSH